MGLPGLSETLALELGGAGIRVNAIALGAVEDDHVHRVLQDRTDSSRRSLDDVAPDAISVQAVKRFTDPHDIAVYALSPLRQHQVDLRAEHRYRRRLQSRCLTSIASCGR
jgi:NAD(P)-dependent dehydrogenase (short-subunit alcohol dehydrogenase family)